MEQSADSEGVGEVYANVSFGRGWFQKEGDQMPRVGRLGTPRFSSTRVLSPKCEPLSSKSVQQVELSTLITDLANQIGQSIAAQLHNDKRENNSASTEGLRSEHIPSELNLSGVKLVMQSDVKEPPVFRGESSDKCTVREWVEMVEMYFKKRHTPTHLQSQEILARLMGKAKDVVRVTLRHNLALDCIQTPELIFDILKQHFGELTYSSMPMADFYSTKPQQNEGVMEYWIRLNNVIDIADECLKRQGRSVEDPGQEVSMMFIKYCPDPVLHNRLSFKAAEEWTTSEVQERIDSFQRELRTQSQIGSQALRRHAISHVQTAISQETETSQSAKVSPSMLSAPGFASHAAPPPTLSAPPISTLASQLSPTAVQFVPAQSRQPTPHLSMEPEPHCPGSVLTSQFTQALTPPSPTVQPNYGPAHCQQYVPPIPTVDVTSMTALFSLLDHMMARQHVQAAAPTPAPSQQFNFGPSQRKNCRVCGGANHSTVMHCKRENLCLACFAPGHWKRECNSQRQRRSGQAETSQSQPSGN